jgi:hypothetical protein
LPSPVVLSWLLFAYLNACVASVAFVLAWSDEVRRRSPLAFFCAWATVYLATIIIVETILGVLGLLTLSALAVVLGVAALAAWLAFLKSGRAISLPPEWRAAWVRLRGILLEERVGILLVATLWLVAALSVTALAEPSGFWDSFVYHLPEPADWLQHATLTPTYIPLAEVSNSYFPGNGELLYFWALAPFRNDLLVRLVPLIVWSLLGLALYRVCRQCGAETVPAVVAAVIFVFTPLVLSEATELSTDVIGTSLFILALGHAFEYVRRPTLSAAALCGLATGMFAGVKYSGPAYAMLLMAAFALILLSLRRSLRLGFVLRSVAVVGLSLCATSAYWYVRNSVLARNPLYPLSLSVAGRVILAGPGVTGDSIWEFAQFVPLRDAVVATLKGYGVVFWLAAAVALVSVGQWLLTRKRGGWREMAPLRPGLLALVTGLMLASLLLYLRTPYSIMRYSRSTPITWVELTVGMRFSLVTGACAAALMAVAMNYSPQRRALPWAAAVLVPLQAIVAGYGVVPYPFFQGAVFTRSRLLVTGLVMAVALVALRLVARTGRPRLGQWLSARRPRAWVLLAAVLVLLFGLFLSYVGQYREEFRYALYEQRYHETGVAWHWIDENINHARVAYVGDPRMLGAYGADLSNEVRYVNVAGGLEERYADYFDRGTGYRSSASYEAWRRNLAAWSAGYLVAATTEQLPEEAWALQHPDVFTLIFSAGPVRVYAISETALAAEKSVP